MIERKSCRRCSDRKSLFVVHFYRAGVYFHWNNICFVACGTSVNKIRRKKK
jgi:hypothetical protein